MGAKLVTFVDRCLGIATERGLASDKPIVLVVKAPTTGEATRIVVSYSEPHDLILPLNVTWIMADSVHADYKKAFKRSSKDAAGGFVHTWGEISTYDEVFIPVQFWDGTDLPQVESTVSEMTTHMAEDVPNDDVHGGKTYTDGKIQQIQTGFGSAFSNMNQRVVFNDQRIRDLETARDTHSETIATLELSKISQDEAITALQQRVTVLEQSGGGGSGSGVNSYTHVATEADTSWIINHNFGTKNLVCQIFDENYNQVLPSGMQAINDNTWVIFFDVDQAGRAILIST